MVCDPFYFLIPTDVALYSMSLSFAFQTFSKSQQRIDTFLWIISYFNRYENQASLWVFEIQIFRRGLTKRLCYHMQDNGNNTLTGAFLTITRYRLVPHFSHSCLKLSPQKLFLARAIVFHGISLKFFRHFTMSEWVIMIGRLCRGNSAELSI